MNNTLHTGHNFWSTCTWLIAPLLALLLVAAACGEGGDMPPVSELTSRDGQGLYSWDTKVWDQVDIPVCWNTAGNATEKGWVRDAVNRAWAQWAHLNFKGWGTCGENPQGIKIDIVDDGPWSWYGVQAKDKDPSMQLNFTFVNFRPGCQGANREVCIRKIAVHEFGHSLAMIHEHQRQDRPNLNAFVNNAGDDQWDKWGSDDESSTYGKYDANSIMTYTYTWFDYDPDKVLSKGDIAGIAAVYGRKPRYSLAGVGGKCLDIKGGTIGEGKVLQMYRCHGKANQQFDVTQYKVAPKGSWLRVAATSDSTFTQASIQQLNKPDKFAMKRYQLVGFGGMCLTDKNGGYVRMMKCDGGDDQLWQKYGTYRLRSVASNKCIINSGPWLKTSSCYKGVNVHFADGAIRLGSATSASCVDVSGGWKALQASYDPYVKTYPCKADGPNAGNQRWVKRGMLRLVSNDGKCLDVKSNTTVNKAKAQVYPCHGKANQQFDYYF